MSDDGTLSDAHGVYAPEVYHSETDDIEIDGVAGRRGETWEALYGYTGQYSYNGAVMHSSEFLGGGLADDILSTPGTYVVVVVNVEPYVAFPHEWSDSGVRCIRCGLIGNGSDNGSCESHVRYNVELTLDDDEDPEPAGWAILRLTEV